MKQKLKIDLNNIKVTNAIASVINGAFETGLNPAWFKVESLNKGGFLDASFADSELDTPSGKPPRTDWTLRACLYDDDSEEEVTKWVDLTPAIAVERWEAYVSTDKKSALKANVLAYLIYLQLLSIDAEESFRDKVLFDWYNPDGVHDDAMGQIAVGKDVIFG
jgi:hypothetical protein